MVNILVTCGSPWQSLFLPRNASETQPSYPWSQAQHEPKKTKVMYNEFAKKVEEPTTIDSNEIDEVDHYIYLGRWIP